MDEITLTPIYRVEHFLDAIVNSTDCPYEARDRIELFLERIAGADIVTPEPQYRIEFYLAKIAGDDVEIPAPQHRAEFYLAALCGEDVELPDPHDRIDYWLYQWAQGGGMPDWQTFSGNPLQFNAPKAHTLKSTTVSFSPIQDLHGYDNPWPAGGGKNKIDVADTTLTGSGYVFNLSGLSIPAGQYTISYTTTASSSASFAASGAGGDYVNTSIPIADNELTFTASGEITGLRLYGATGTYSKIQLESGSSKTSFAPYSNICPISGRTGVDVFVRGNNTWDEEWANGYFNTTTGAFTESASNTTLCAKNYIPVKGGTTYCFVQPINQSPQVYQYDKSEGFIGRITGISANNGTFTVDANCAFIKFAVFSYGSGHYDKDVSINYPSTDTEYHAYTGQTYSISLPSTVYGGTASVAEDGTATGTDGWDVYDLGSFPNSYTIYISDPSWSVYGFNTTADTLPCKAYTSVTQKEDIMCSAFPTEAYYKVFNGQARGIAISSNGNARYVRISDPTLDGKTAAEVKTLMSGVMLAYLRLTPTPFTVTPSATPTAVQDINTMWTDGDNLTVEARGEAVNLNALQSLNMLLGGRYVNNHTDEDLSDEEALDIILNGGNR